MHKCAHCENLIDYGYLCRRCDFEEKEKRNKKKQEELDSSVRLYENAKSNLSFAGLNFHKFLISAVIFGLIGFYTGFIQEFKGLGEALTITIGYTIIGLFFPLIWRMAPTIWAAIKAMKAWSDKHN